MLDVEWISSLLVFLCPGYLIFPLPPIFGGLPYPPPGEASDEGLAIPHGANLLFTIFFMVELKLLVSDIGLYEIGFSFGLFGFNTLIIITFVQPCGY